MIMLPSSYGEYEDKGNTCVVASWCRMHSLGRTFPIISPLFEGTGREEHGTLPYHTTLCRTAPHCNASKPGSESHHIQRIREVREKNLELFFVLLQFSLF